MTIVRLRVVELVNKGGGNKIRSRVAMGTVLCQLLEAISS
jgi:hypothetical protein